MSNHVHSQQHLVLEGYRRRISSSTRRFEKTSGALQQQRDLNLLLQDGFIKQFSR